jgi:hypothetical protein
LLQQEPSFEPSALQVALHLPSSHFFLHSSLVAQQFAAFAFLQEAPLQPFVEQSLQQSLSVHLFFLQNSMHSLLHLSVQHLGLSSPKFLKLKLNKHTSANNMFFILISV